MMARFYREWLLALPGLAVMRGVTGSVRLYRSPREYGLKVSDKL